jgi:hypothetical protein
MEIREARPKDAEGLAQIWLEFGRHYAELDPDEFRVPAQEGLAGWIEGRTRMMNANVKRLVAEIDGHVAGFAVGTIIEPAKDAERQERRMAYERRSVRFVKRL